MRCKFTARDGGWSTGHVHTGEEWHASLFAEGFSVPEILRNLHEWIMRGLK